MIETQLNSELQVVTSWLQKNLLSLNVLKTVFMVFTRQTYRPINVLLNNTHIEQVYETKFLGVLISTNLLWKAQIDSVCSKVIRSIGTIAKIRYLLPQNLVRQLYLSLVQPHMMYCCLVWASDSKSVILSRLHKLYKNIAA